MATGDIKNNIRKLKQLLKTIRYEEEIDLPSLTEGSATVYLPIYHYVFTLYSTKVAEFILSKNFELYGKSDARFIEVIYKILRDVFSYKPPVTKDQFFAKGFSERKIIMCSEILQLIKNKHTQLNPGPSKTAMKASVRPKSAIETKTQGAQSSAPSKVKRPSTARVSPRLSEGHQGQPAQVVNELVTAPLAPPVRHTAHIPEPRSMTRHMPDRTASVSSDAPQPSQNEFVTVRTPDVNTCENASQIGLKTTMTTPPSMINKQFRPDLVEVVSMPRQNLRPSIVSQDISIVDVEAKHNESYIQSPAAETQQLRSMIKHVEDLTDCLKKQFEDAVKVIHDKVETRENARVIELENRIVPQLENLTAQMILMDNRLQIVEMKVDNIYKPTIQAPAPQSSFQDLSNIHKHVTINDQGSSFASQQKFMADPRVKNMMQDPINASLEFASPIRKTANGVHGEMYSANEETFMTQATEPDPRRSSTPMAAVRNEPSFLGAASRIEQMVQSTNQMLKDKQEIQSLRNNVD